MRIFLAAAAALIISTIGAYAGDTEGKITKVDVDTMTIVLDDGKSYKLPPEMDMSAVVEDVEVTIAFDTHDGVNQITDMVFQ